MLLKDIYLPPEGGRNYYAYISILLTVIKTRFSFIDYSEKVFNESFLIIQRSFTKKKSELDSICQ